MCISLDSVDFLKCNSILRLDFWNPDAFNPQQEGATLKIWVSYNNKVLEMTFGGVVELTLPPVYGAISIGELFVQSRKADGLEGINFEVSDELTGLHILSRTLLISEVPPSRLDSA